MHKQIDKQHLLYGRKVFPIAIRQDPDAVIYETDDEPFINVLVYLSWYGDALSAKRSKPLKMEILPDRPAIQARIDKDKAEWLAQFSESE
ncbi:MAG: hypothetical protein QNJ54_32010 [Prochloraceae cyanobacterium]|nr:hypothetical protein [Prochloraceae cyanobacterium]